MNLPESFDRSQKTIRETRLLKKAVKQGWKIPEDLKDAIAARQADIAINAESIREATSAAKCLVAMEQQNQTDDIRTDLNSTLEPVDLTVQIQEMLSATLTYDAQMVSDASASGSESDSSKSKKIHPDQGGETGLQNGSL